MEISEHPLTNGQITDLVARIADKPADTLSNFVCVVRTTDGEMLILSPDPHRDCISRMLGDAYLHMTDHEDNELVPDGSVQLTNPDGTVTRFIPDEG